MRPESRLAWRATGADALAVDLAEHAARRQRDVALDGVDLQEQRGERRAQLVRRDGQELVARHDRRLRGARARVGLGPGPAKRGLAGVQPAVAVRDVRRQHDHDRRRPRPLPGQRGAAAGGGQDADPARQHGQARADDRGRMILDDDRDRHRQRQHPVEERARHAAGQRGDRRVEGGREDRQRQHQLARARRPGAAQVERGGDDEQRPEEPHHQRAPGEVPERQAIGQAQHDDDAGAQQKDPLALARAVLRPAVPLAHRRDSKPQEPARGALNR